MLRVCKDTITYYIWSMILLSFHKVTYKATLDIFDNSNNVILLQFIEFPYFNR